MSRSVRLMVWIVALPAAMSLAGGCAHPCGYLGIRTERTVLEGERTTAFESDAEALRVVKELSPENPWLVARLERREITFAPVRAQVFGHRIRVPWRWYIPIFKPLCAATVVIPLVSSWQDPHYHDGRSWGVSDYLIDVLDWFNPVTGAPVGPRVVDAGEVLIRTDERRMPVADRLVGIPDRTVTLCLGGEDRAAHMSDEEGTVRFDLSRYLTAELARDDVAIEIVSRSPRPDGNPAVIRWTLSSHTMQQWLASGEQPADAE